MPEPQTSKTTHAPTNGTTKERKTRTRKTLDAATAATRIAEMLKALPSGERAKAEKILEVLMADAT